MTNKEINIAIAGACGAKCQTCGGDPSQHDMSCDGLPDYCSDLNAMHEAEKFLDGEIVDVQSMYWDYLALVTMPDPFPGDDTFLRDFKLIRATARQRAEAFLRTIGKWMGE